MYSFTRGGVDKTALIRVLFRSYRKVRGRTSSNSSSNSREATTGPVRVCWGLLKELLGVNLSLASSAADCPRPPPNKPHPSDFDQPHQKSPASSTTAPQSKFVAATMYDAPPGVFTLLLFTCCLRCLLVVSEWPSAAVSPGMTANALVTTAEEDVERERRRAEVRGGGRERGERERGESVCVCSSATGRSCSGARGRSLRG